MLTTIAVGWAAYRFGAKSARQAQCVDLRRSLLDKLAELHHFVLTATAEHHPRDEPASREWVNARWLRVLADFELVKLVWKPHRINTSDERMVEHDRMFRAYIGKTGQVFHLDVPLRTMRDEVVSWKLA